MSTSELSTVRNNQSALSPASQPVRPGFESAEGFKLLTQMATVFAKSHVVPMMFRANPNNALIACHMATRIGCDPLTVMQNLYLVNNKPGWSSQFLIASWNTCGRFTPIRFEFTEDGQCCRAVSKELATGQQLRSPLITMKMAKAEGWIDKKGSKWVTMPELMMQYRAAAFLVRLFAPELALGLHSSEEREDMTGAEATQVLTEHQLEAIAAAPEIIERPMQTAATSANADVVTESPDETHQPAEPDSANGSENKTELEVDGTDASSAQLANESPAGAESSTSIEVNEEEEMVHQQDLKLMLGLINNIQLPPAKWKEVMSKFDVASARELSRANALRVIAWLQKEKDKRELNSWANNATKAGGQPARAKSFQQQS